MCSFNPAEEYPSGDDFSGGSFPRPWPFVGGRLPPTPPDPPTRCILKKKDRKWTLVRLQETVPTVEVAGPSRAQARNCPRLLRRRRRRSPPLAA